MTREKLLKKLDLKPWEIELLDEDDCIDYAVDEEEMGKGAGVRYLREVLDGKKRWVEASQKNQRQKPAPKTKTIEAPPDGRFIALTRVLAVMVAEDAQVQRFRREVLGGQLLAPADVPAWIEAQASKEQPTLTVLFVLEDVDDWKAQIVQQLAADDPDDPLVGGTWHKLRYYSPVAGVSAVPINIAGVLGRLKRIAMSFRRHWPEAAAVYLILTGEARPISPARTTVDWGTVPKITLKLSPHVVAEDVFEIYVIAKRQLQEEFGESRRLSEKHLALAVFFAEEKGTWPMLLARWNQANSQWQYKEKRTFSRDMKKAFERLTGRKR